jgi:hypothetical protein
MPQWQRVVFSFIYRNILPNLDDLNTDHRLEFGCCFSLDLMVEPCEFPIDSRGMRDKLAVVRRFFHTVRFPLVALVFAGWLVASNHCALSSLIGPRSEIHICCKKEPATQTGKSCAEKCCKALSVPIPEVQSLPGGPSCDGLLAFQDQPSDMAWTHAPGVLASGPAPPDFTPSFFIQHISGSNHQAMAPPDFVV